MMHACYVISTGEILYTVQDGACPPEGKGRAFATISPEQARSLAGLRVINGSVAFADIEPVRAEAVRVIDNTVGNIRRYFVSDLPGQDMIYQRKAEEAKNWLQTTNPSLPQFPFLQAEVGVTAPSADQLAQVWLNMSDGWVAVACLIEHARFTASANVQAATTPEGVAAALTTFTETLAVLGA